METTTKMFCDYCGEEITSNTYSTIEIKIAFKDKEGAYSNMWTNKDVCNVCMYELGFKTMKGVHSNNDDAENLSKFGKITILGNNLK